MIKVVDILKENENPCWKGYRQVGMKTKNGREVPNCVPESVVKEDLEDVIHQVKKFDKPKDEKLLTIKVINKLKDKRNKSNSPSNKEKLQKLIDKIEGDYKKGKYIKESVNEAYYTAIANLGTTKAKENLDSFDELQRFMDKMKQRKAISVQVTKIKNGKKQTIDYDWDGRNWVSKNKTGIQESNQLKETMIRRAVDLAQEILPKDIWSRYASDGQKNKEFVKSIVRDLTNMLNRFYKSYDVNVRIKEDILHEIVNKPYNEDLRKWLGSGPTGGWDRYSTTGEKLGKCGDAKDGEPYSACLSNEKAKKLGKDGIASFVRRKRAAQKKAGDAKKGGEQSKGQKPTFVKTGA